MKENIITLLGLASYSQDRKIPKNIFYVQDDFSKNAERLFIKDVDTISLIATLTTNNTNIPSLITDDEYYAELQVLFITIRNKQSIDKISTIVHQIIPNPLLLIIQYESKINLTVTYKRRNKVDKSKQVIEDIYMTDRLDTNVGNGFRQDMYHQSHIFTNLKRYYEGRLYPILIMQYQHLWGGYRTISLDKMPQIFDVILQYQSLQKQIDQLELTYKQTVSMGEQTKLYMQVKSLKEQQQILIATI